MENSFIFAYNMEIKDRIAVGIRLHIGEGIPLGKCPNEFEKQVSCSISGLDLGFDTVLDCKYYDDMTGYIYFHFETPIKRETIEMFFDEHEIIDELEEQETIIEKVLI